jgi:V/A-type H+-transporting ATPase subunit D|uniref:V-type ATP synthase subunit D n=1 Tax=candidate division WOR-3 bacterium TaxID=2052148 RepID=A0A7C4UGB5_UNCW3
MKTINATRMELLNQKKRLAIARRGHKLLKDKRDELMRAIQVLLKEIFQLRLEVEEGLREAMRRFALAKGTLEPYFLSDIFAIKEAEFEVKASYRNIMNVKIPLFEHTFKGKLASYGYLWTSGEIDIALRKLEEVLEKMIKLAEKEKGLIMLSEEMVRTRRRVNALEYRIIPETEETIKFINLKLSEIEKSNISRLMRIKDVIRKE